MWLEIVLIILFAIVFVLLIKGLIRSFLRLQTLWRARKNLADFPRKGGGIVFNKKTGRLEKTSDNVVLPFD